MKRILFASLLCLLLAAQVLAQGERQGPVKLVIHEAYVGDPPAGVTPQYTWTLGQKDKTYTLNLVKQESLSTTMSVLDVNNAVEMYKPNFRLAGDDKAVGVITSAKPGQALKIIANVRTTGEDRLFEAGTAEPAAAPK